MRKLSIGIALGLLISMQIYARANFELISPETMHKTKFNIPASSLCETSKSTLAYLNKGINYDKKAIHDSEILSIKLAKIKSTLKFICENEKHLNDPKFLTRHFDFVRWYPDTEHAKHYSANKPLLKNIPSDKILMTKYYVHVAHASTHPTTNKTFAIYGTPYDEKGMTVEQAITKKHLVRFKYGKQAILSGALDKKAPILAYVSRDDLEMALRQGTIIAKFGGDIPDKTFNVHRCNNIAYDRSKNQYDQERYWFFKEVDGIKGYGKDADYKIKIHPEVTFAGDIEKFGLGQLLLIQYPDDKGENVSHIGVLADTGGAFANNLYQIDYLAGAYEGFNAYLVGTRNLPDYVNAYFMVLKDKYS